MLGVGNLNLDGARGFGMLMGFVRDRTTARYTQPVRRAKHRPCAITDPALPAAGERVMSNS
jgi:hypothetical protein